MVPDAERTRRRGRTVLAAGVLLATLCIPVGGALAHPTAKELLERARSAGLCARSSNPDAWADDLGLGATESALREAFGDALVVRPIEMLDPEYHRVIVPKPPGQPDADAAAAPTADSFAGQLRLRRSVADSDVQTVEYELFRGVVYRVRWRLADRFEVPILDDLVHQAGHCYGPPDYDQTIEATLGSGEVTRRRAGWERGERLLEVRQLNPLNGGPLYVTVTDLAAGQQIIAAKGSLAPEPERRDQPWWERGVGGPPAIPEEAARSELVRAFAATLSATDFQRSLEKPPAPAPAKAP